MTTMWLGWMMVASVQTPQRDWVAEAQAPPRESECVSGPDAGNVGLSGTALTFVVNAPVTAVLDALTDVSRYPAMLSTVDTAEVVSRSVEYTDVKLRERHGPFTTAYTIRCWRDDARGTVRWRELSGDVKLLRGVWTVHAVAPRYSEVRMELYMDMGDAIPGFIQRRFIRRFAREMVEGIRRAATMGKSGAQPDAAVPAAE